MESQSKELPNSIIFGTGEYSTGYVAGTNSKSDKKIGVVSLVHFDLKYRKKIGDRIVLVGVNGTKFPGIREHLKKNIEDAYTGLITAHESFPDDSTCDATAYLKALETMEKGDIASLFTPDDTHFMIAKATLERGIHLMVTKPVVKTLKEHQILVDIAKKNNVLLMVEVHKRFDPIYSDARQKISAELGEFGYFYSYMS